MAGKVLAPGLIDAHMHIETSMVSPAQLSAVLTAHGTTTLITDPHEIANVMGADGIRYMLQATEGCCQAVSRQQRWRMGMRYCAQRIWSRFTSILVCWALQN